MDSLELLNVLDVIKNEEVYTKRLNDLKAVQLKLDQTKHTHATSDLAEKALYAAKAQEAKATELVKKLEEDLKRVKQEVDKDYETKFAEVKAKEKAIHRYAEEAKHFLNQAKEQNAKIEKEREKLHEWDVLLNKQQASVDQIESILSSKFARIKQIIEE